MSIALFCRLQSFPSAVVVVKKPAFLGVQHGAAAYRRHQQRKRQPSGPIRAFLRYIATLYSEVRSSLLTFGFEPHLSTDAARVLLLLLWDQHAVGCEAPKNLRAHIRLTTLSAIAFEENRKDTSLYIVAKTIYSLLLRLLCTA